MAPAAPRGRGPKGPVVMIEKSVTPDICHRESLFRKREALEDRSDGSPLTTSGDDGESHVMPDIRHRASILASFPMEPRSQLGG